jgi:predicted nuclease with TOPRIM domain
MNDQSTVTALHNQPDRAAAIQDVCRRLENLEGEISALQEDRRNLKNEVVKGKLGLKLSDFNVAYRLYKLEGDDRDTMLDTMRECFEALGVGGQLDWIKAAEAAE